MGAIMAVPPTTNATSPSPAIRSARQSRLSSPDDADTLDGEQ